ncbi:NADH-quinone oxidoreductase subunit L [Rhodocytophaga rosea]|uniref:NADH-quinone oxidoreductase subunit L n=1 Tax=Rhodocytophaga rosea TaxID=2704465 RepID=A0A6C0GPL8_9BACT|nr:NADH-quinone oxidoreductase subunit L [Rhodocytophaga rosea]QHT70015.1 NADH-quinone oxidoreductase subunit L [Rhodocytophaga rosea]
MPDDVMVISALLLVCLPLLVSGLLLFAGKKYPSGSAILTIISTGICFLLSTFLFLQSWPDSIYTFQYSWFHVGRYTFTADILIDKWAACMLLVVSFISLLVQVYSTAYMKGDIRYAQYFAYLSLFMAAMLGIVLAGNLLVMYVAWELVGFSSYLLIGFWLEKPQAARAARNAFLVNRVGDTGFLLAIIILLVQFGTLDIQTLITSPASIDPLWLTIAGLGLFSGCVAKSAQFPLQIWLPGAMAGPTPVSALIHAATMVAAGVFLLVRMFPLFNAEVLTVIAITGTITAFMGAVAALFQTDIKRLLAFSTISQLGYMVMGIGVGAYQAAFLHLLTHAFFKACLFLSAGAVIHSLHQLEHNSHMHFDTQDMRLMGGLRKQMPVTFICYLLAGLSLAGLPLFSGFLSKDAILLGALNWADSRNHFLWYLIPDIGFITAFLTALYIGRQLILVFLGAFRLPHYLPIVKHSQHDVRDVPAVMKMPMGTLAVLSLFVFFSFNPFNASGGWLLSRLHTTPESASSWHSFAVIMSIVLSTGGLATAYFLTGNNRFKVPQALKNISLHNWYLSIIYRKIFINPGRQVVYSAQQTDAKVIDKLVDYTGIITVVLAHIIAWVDRIFVDGTVNLISRMAGYLGLFTKSAQTGKIQHYFIFALAGLLILVFWIIL